MKIRANDAVGTKPDADSTNGYHHQYDAAMHSAWKAFVGMEPHEDFGLALNDQHSLVNCDPATASLEGRAVWQHTNGLPLGSAHTKACNACISSIRNVTTDAELPANPGIAHGVGHRFKELCVEAGLMHASQPEDNSGAGLHFIIPIFPIAVNASTAADFNDAVSRCVRKHYFPLWNRACAEVEGGRALIGGLGGFDISRVMSPAGCWRPTSKKDDCDALKPGVLRTWQAPYVDGHYPVRVELSAISLYIRHEYDALLKERESAPKKSRQNGNTAHGNTKAELWLIEYNEIHKDEYKLRADGCVDRSHVWHKLVGALLAKFKNEDVVYDVAETLNQLTGKKYEGRLSDEIMRSLATMQVPDEEEKGSEPKEKSKQSQADILLEMALKNAVLFTTSDGEYCARIMKNGHQVTVPINERAGPFKSWLIHLFSSKLNTIPSASALSSAVSALLSEAQFGVHETLDVSVRIAEHGGKVYLDLAQGEFVEVDGNGWRILQQSPVSFKQHGGMLPLPRPVRGGKIEELRRFVNVKTDEDWVLTLSWLIGCLHPTGPYPILDVHGEQGSTKSTATRLMRTTIDPSRAPTRKEPDDNRTLAIMAHNNRVLAFDNLSYLPAWLSDALCRLATGAGDAYRALYTDGDEVIFDAKRPIIFNGIEEIATRGDLLNRAITVTMVQPKQYLTERRFWEEFDTAHPRILGALLDIVSCAIRNLPTVSETNLPRMADFAMWILACESMFAEPGAFMAAYSKNQENAVLLELEASDLAMTIIKCMENGGSWEGTMTLFLERLDKKVSDETRKSKSWPKNARALSGRLDRLAPSLRSVGIHIVKGRGNKGSTVYISKQASGDANDAKSDANDDGSDANNEKVTQNK